MRRAFLTTLLALGLLAAIAAPPAVARQNADGNGRSDEHRRVVDYWTAARRAGAVPRDVGLADRNGKPGGQAKPSKPGGSSTSGTWTQGGDVTVTTGKVFFTLGGVNYVCSGSAVASPSGSSTDSLVLTAGHCVHDGGGGPFATNWIFYPRYASGPDPTLGAWTASDLFVTDEWARSTDFDHDAGFAVVGNGTSTTLEQAVAAQNAPAPDIAFGDSYTGTHYAFGYPAAGKFDGQTLQFCSGSVRVRWDGHDTVAMSCDMTGGSSGGPWFGSWNDTEKTGTLRSLNSYTYRSVKNTMFGPIFDGPEQDAFNAARSGNCGGATMSAAYACADL